jgi:tetratricopeptide (TPR) repeat protein
MKRIDEMLAAFDELSPGNPDALLQVGQAMAGARQYDEAAALLNRALEMAPHRIEGLVELGLSELQAGRLDEAARALDAAAKLDNFNVRADNSRKLLDEIRTFVSHESEHFIVRCKPGVDEIVAKEMLKPLERIFARVTGSEAGGIDHEPARKTVVELYPNHRWFAVRITGMTGIHTIAAATGPVIAMEAPAEGAGHLGPYDWPRVVQHEFTHTVTLSRTKNRLPHWFTEASAVFLEDAPRDWNTVNLLRSAYENDALFDFSSINLAFVRPKRAQDRSLAYAQGHWMYEYMIERFGPRSVLDLMDLYAQGTSEADAFTQVLKVSRETFLADFKTWAGTQLIAWGIHPPVGTPKLSEILKEAKIEPAEITLEQVDGLLTSHPGHADLLRLKIKMVTEDEKPSQQDIPLLILYANARPVDPLPHRLLAALYLSGELPDASPAIIVPHLEYLDAREQSSPVYAKELASLYAGMDRMDLALAKSARATQIAPYSAVQREAAAAFALRAKAYDVAEQHIRVLMALEPERPIHGQRLEALTRLRDSP